MADTPYTRRALLRAIPATMAIPAMGMAAIVPAEAAPIAEPAVTIVNNLASELSYALDDWCDEISHPDCPRQEWMAHIYPASHHKYAVSFENIRARRIETPEQIMGVYRAAMNADYSTLVVEDL